MQEEFKKHVVYYLFLTIFFALGIILLSQFSYDKRMQGEISVGIIVVYVFWAIAHHVVHHDVTAKIVIEYVLMGSLGITLLLFLLRGFGL
ncbi:MAG: hypothetical protein HY429_03280 [Candidatus Levybacteria bacterium]|nr:hypothetical protein [Candidatus Levybacteria bacterium]